MKRKAPVQASGGAGFRYENAVAGRFLVALLGGTNPLGIDFGRVSRIDWQARDAGWLADDVAITCETSDRERSAGVSAKSAKQVTRSGFSEDFVEIAWALWFGINTPRKLRDSNDAVVLVTGSLAHDVQEAWSNILSEALETTPDRMATRLSRPVPTVTALNRLRFSARYPKASAVPQRFKAMAVGDF